MNWQLKKRLLSLISNPKGVLKDLMPELRDLRNQMGIYLNTSVPSLSQIAPFCNIVSKWHDRGLDRTYTAFDVVNYGQYDGMLDTLAELERQFREAGRSRRGMNRTKRGQVVTANDIYLGNIFGIKSAPLSYWLKHQHEPMAGLDHPTTSAHDIVSVQADRFIKTYAQSIINLINQLERKLG